MQGTQVWALVREGPACHGATKPMRHNYWACALDLVSHNYWACVPQLLEPVCLEPVLHNKRSRHSGSPCTAMKSRPRLLQLEKARAQQRRPNTAKNKFIKKKKSALFFCVLPSWWFCHINEMCIHLIFTSFSYEKYNFVEITLGKRNLFFSTWKA